jgi:hypothetical protein
MSHTSEAVLVTCGTCGTVDQIRGPWEAPAAEIIRHHRRHTVEVTFPPVPATQR